MGKDNTRKILLTINIKDYILCSEEGAEVWWNLGNKYKKASSLKEFDAIPAGERCVLVATAEGGYVVTPVGEFIKGEI